MTDIVAIDIGGTHARFAIAAKGADGAVRLGEVETLPTDDFPGLEDAWAEFEQRHADSLPKAAAIAIAGPVTGESVRMTNNSWEIHAGALAERLGLERVTMLNDFAAVAHAAATSGGDQFVHLAGPDRPLPEQGTITVAGPGTGLGIAHFHRFAGGYHVQATEGSHIGFAPTDTIDDAILERMRARFGRVSVERVVSGPGIADIHAALAAMDGRCEAPELDDRTIWQRGMGGEDELAAASVERFCVLLGRAAGDFALAHGASGVVIAGGLGLRLRAMFAASGFAQAFRDKGRYEGMMDTIPVKLLTHPQPGLIGAAAAFAAEHGW